MNSDPISESTPKRRKINHSGGYDSQNDSGDDLFNGMHDTIATIPLGTSQRPPPDLPFSRLMSELQSGFSTPRHLTQPTQPLSSPSVQVPRSSPPPSSPSPRSQRPMFQRPRGLASAMAPPGTTFRRPVGVQQRPTLTQDVDRSLEDPPIPIDSDDDNEMSNNDVAIKPTNFTKGTPARNSPSPVKESPRPDTDKFAAFTSQYAYGNGAPVVVADDMSSAYGGQQRKRRLHQGTRQNGPARAVPVEEDMLLEDIPDPSIRTSIGRMQNVYPNKSVRTLEAALRKARYRLEDALNDVAGMDDEDSGGIHIDLTSSDVESNASKLGARPVPRKPAAKQQLKAPVRTIQEKYSSRPSIAKNHSEPQEVAKPRRRLMKGRKHPSSPVELSPVRAETPPKNRALQRITIDSDSDEVDSATVSADEEEETRNEKGLLNFLNTCSDQELADLANEKVATAAFILSHRPFKSLNAARAVEEVGAASKKPRKGAAKRTTGERIMDICEEMWAGYEAVDQLVEKCDAVGKPIMETMKAWGLDLQAAATTGEMAFTKIEDAHDSGIGTPASSIMDDDVVSPVKKRGVFLKQPQLLPSENVTMKDYQLFGLNWLNLLWSKKLSCILADDMGLGKTCQVIAFLAHLREINTPGVHVVVVPGSTLENWLREFGRFAPDMRVEPYYGSMAEREQQRAAIEDDVDQIDVIVTTYDIAVGEKGDNKFLRKIRPTVCVFDEGHTLKNSKTRRHQQLMRIPAQFRLLLTGTPLQNNLQELVSLLGFILPDLFEEKKDELESIFKYKATTKDGDHAALLSAQRIARARSMMAPFVLRRKKAQVLKDIPTKHSRVELCDMVPSQQEFYQNKIQIARDARDDSTIGTKGGSKMTFHMMALRLAALHPLLQRRIYSEEKLRELQRILIDSPYSEFRDNREDLVWKFLTSDLKGGDYGLHKFCSERSDYIPKKYTLRNEEWMDSGKIVKLQELLEKFIKNGDRVLVFSQFTSMMDIMEAVFETLSIKFTRLDGSTPMAQRQDIIDQFTVDESIPVFMLSTKAGGAGINLACANKVIIVDSSFNPQEDIQAENRAHRVGQTREVEVVRLVTRDTIEEKIYALGESKLMMDSRVSGESGEGVDAKQVEKEGEKMVEKMLFEQLDKPEAAKGDVVKEEVRLEQDDNLKLCDTKDKGDLKDQFRKGLKKAGLDVMEE